MKKLFMSIIVLCLVLSITACDTNTDAPAPPPTLAPKVENTPEPTEAPSATEAPIIYEAKPEILAAGWDSGLIQVNDQLIQLPLSLSELLALGFDYQLDGGKTPKETLFTSGDLIYLDIISNGENLFRITPRVPENTDQITAEALNPIVKHINVSGLFKTNTVYFPGGLTLSAPASAMEECLGTPFQDGDSEHYIEKIYGTSGLIGLIVYIDERTQTIRSLYICKALNAKQQDDFTSVTFENVKNTQDPITRHKITLLHANHPDYLELEDKINIYTKTVIDYEDEKYLMELKFHTSLLEYYNPLKHNHSGEPLYDVTDEYGITRRVFFSDSTYILECITDTYVLDGFITFENMSSQDKDPYALLQNFVIDIGKSVQFSE